MGQPEVWNQAGYYQDILPGGRNGQRCGYWLGVCNLIQDLRISSSWPSFLPGDQRSGRKAQEASPSSSQHAKIRCFHSLTFVATPELPTPLPLPPLLSPTQQQDMAVLNLVKTRDEQAKEGLATVL